MDALSYQDLLRHRLNAVCKESEDIHVLCTALAMSIHAIQQELLERGWSDKDSALAIVDALRCIEEGLLEELVS